MRGKVVARIDDMQQEKRWPRWTSEVRPLGIVSMLSVPLIVRDEAIGAIKLYSSRRANYDEDDERTVGFFSDEAAVLLANVSSFTEARRLGDQLKEALETRDTIGMAKGILMSQQTLDEETAFEMLRRGSQDSNVKLREIARELVRRTAGRAKG